MAYGGTVLAVAFDPQGKLLAIGCADKKLRVLDAGTGALVWRAASLER